MTYLADAKLTLPGGNDPYDPVMGCNQPYWQKDIPFFNKLYSVSPAGAPEPYGYFPPVTVRTVGFGAIPVEATVEVSQVRDADNLPVPLLSEATEDIYWSVGNGDKPGVGNCGKNSPWPHGAVLHDATVTGKVNVLVSIAAPSGEGAPWGAKIRLWLRRVLGLVMAPGGGG